MLVPAYRMQAQNSFTFYSSSLFRLFKKNPHCECGSIYGFPLWKDKEKPCLILEKKNKSGIDGGEQDTQDSYTHGHRWSDLTKCSRQTHQPSPGITLGMDSCLLLCCWLLPACVYSIDSEQSHGDWEAVNLWQYVLEWYYRAKKVSHNCFREQQM